MTNDKTQFRGTGRRKSAVATTIFQPHVGDTQQITINGKKAGKYMEETFYSPIELPIKALGLEDMPFNCRVKVVGGGKHGQAGAIQLSLAKALLAYNPEFRTELASRKLLTTDSRRVEPKRYGYVKSRAKQAFKKR